MDERVIIVGGGPCGLAAAFFLTRRGVPVTLLERFQTPSEDPRAATFHPPTLEILAEGGITARLHEIGIVAPLWQFRGRSEGLVAEFDLGILKDETPFPYRLQCEQHKFARLLHDHLVAHSDVEFHFDSVVETIEQDGDGVTVTTADGGAFRGAYVIGADGGRSLVRKSQAIAFEGFTFPERFLVVTTTQDFAEQGFAYSNYVSDPQLWAALFKVPGDRPRGLWRVVSPVAAEDDDATMLDFATAQQRLQTLMPQTAPYEIVHTNIYAVHQRVAGTFRKGRVLLIGDAAHVNNPLGGMGMNFGIHDAFNASETLAHVWNGADPSLLDRFDRQRRHVANAFLQTMSIQNKQALEDSDLDSRAKRLRDMRETAADPDRTRAYLMRTSMLESIRVAAAIQ